MRRTVFFVPDNSSGLSTADVRIVVWQLTRGLVSALVLDSRGGSLTRMWTQAEMEAPWVCRRADVRRVRMYQSVCTPLAGADRYWDPWGDHGARCARFDAERRLGRSGSPGRCGPASDAQRRERAPPPRRAEARGGCLPLGRVGRRTVFCARHILAIRCLGRWQGTKRASSPVTGARPWSYAGRRREENCFGPALDRPARLT
jgi:hypothetical protein